jgi:hypothetical protein
MAAKPGETKIPPPDAAVPQPQGELVVLAAPADKILVIAVHPSGVDQPKGEVTPSNPLEMPDVSK